MLGNVLKYISFRLSRDFLFIDFRFPGYSFVEGEVLLELWFS